MVWADASEVDKCNNKSIDECALINFSPRSIYIHQKYQIFNELITARTNQCMQWPMKNFSTRLINICHKCKSVNMFEAVEILKNSLYIREVTQM